MLTRQTAQQIIDWISEANSVSLVLLARRLQSRMKLVRRDDSSSAQELTGSEAAVLSTLDVPVR